MKRMFRHLTLVIAAQILTGCELALTSQESAALSPIPSEESAALLEAHSEESLAELRQSAQVLFGGRQITIGATAFANSNQLLIQRAVVRLPDGRIIDNRVDEPPFILELFLREGGCYLRNKETSEEVRLTKVDCVAM